jgi:hypothetical protein
MRNALLLVAIFAASLTPLSAQPSSDAIKPFGIRIPDAALSDLKARLETPRFPEPLQGDGWTQGTRL